MYASKILFRIYSLPYQYSFTQYRLKKIALAHMFYFFLSLSPKNPSNQLLCIHVKYRNHSQGNHLYHCYLLKKIQKKLACIPIPDYHRAMYHFKCDWGKMLVTIKLLVYKTIITHTLYIYVLYTHVYKNETTFVA